MSTPTYTPSADLDPNPVGPYTMGDLVGLCAHHDMETELRELADGRVVLSSWDPASANEPVVVAIRND